MSIFDKIVRSWWVILSCIFMANGFGFLYIGYKHNNKNWMIEGLMYEIPWIFSMIYVDYAPLFNPFITLSVILMLISIVRSIWVAVKLADVYDNEEKYAVRPTVIKNHDAPQEGNNSYALGCCLCIIVIFVLFVMIEIF